MLFSPELDLLGVAETAKDVDYQIKLCGAEGIVASSDGSIIDSVSKAVDLPGEIASRLGIAPRRI